MAALPAAALAARRRHRRLCLLELHLPVPPRLRALARRAARLRPLGDARHRGDLSRHLRSCRHSARHVALLGLRRSEAAHGRLCRRRTPQRSHRADAAAEASAACRAGAASLRDADRRVHGAHCLPHALRARAGTHHGQRCAGAAGDRGGRGWCGQAAPGEHPPRRLDRSWLARRRPGQARRAHWRGAGAGHAGRPRACRRAPRCDARDRVDARRASGCPSPRHRPRLGDRPAGFDRPPR